MKIDREKQINYWKKTAQKLFEESNFSLLLPPPNITGKLHLGHALDSILQDFLVRYFFLRKRKVKWILGVDHAGISAQNKIDSLAIEFSNIQEKLDYTLNFWYPETKKNFVEQWLSMGLLIDPNNISFTFDEIRQKQVKQAFVKLYNDGFIYRGKKIVNWDPKLESVISDIEVEHLPVSSKLYFLKYFISGGKEDEYLAVATTRPETFFADVALFINPADERYSKYINKFAIHPWNQKKIPILFDSFVKTDFGTGVLKCSPGHDKNDYDLASKYNLPIIACCDEKGILNSLAFEWEGQLINSIRENLVALLIAKDICYKIEDIKNEVAFSSKSFVPIEPLLSWQWFLDLTALIKVVEKKNPNFSAGNVFVPEQFAKILNDWKEKAGQWCISRQLWWGHRIPAWFNVKTKQIHVGDEPVIDRHLWTADKDVLDTWFSSSLWPIISTATSDDNLSDLIKSFHPITYLITGYDILFFWVLKMIIFSLYFTSFFPFKKILLHGLIRDKEGRKMSKSLNNGIIPDYLIKKYGADPLRLFFCENNIWGSDLIFQEEKLIGNWRLIEKISSIANFFSLRLPESNFLLIDVTSCFEYLNDDKQSEFSKLIAAWILHHFFVLKERYLSKIENENFSINSAFFLLSSFIKKTFSSEYLELVKVEENLNSRINIISLYVFQQFLVLFHPFAPFVTERIYNEFTKNNLLENEINEFCPQNFTDVVQIDLFLQIVHQIRSLLKKEIRKIFLQINNREFDFKFDLSFYLEKLLKISFETTCQDLTSFLHVNSSIRIWYQENSLIPEAEKQKMFNHYLSEINRSQKLLANNSFLEKAPKWMIFYETKKLEENKRKLNDLEKTRN